MDRADSLAIVNKINMSFFVIPQSPDSLGGGADLGEKVDPRQIFVLVVLRDPIDYLDMRLERWMCTDLPKCPNALRRPFGVDVFKDVRGALLVPVSAHQPQRP